ncbi:hypothetical protein [Xanthomonas hortorum]|uniref:hypothetical protein n=1 Tax=Xanthomonas hortorum TaxID=56454 RepID=UPI000CEDCDC7|nr:hypothetical protein XcyCFBP4188_12000 [Xanthomonas hortorum pv. cynarae]CAD0303627.1 hypothetical protein CFBP2044_04910 [Xanthomonas hortorum pv. cynarae]CAD0303630.1 hypothetical protein CFBP2044_04910 [Xanthomonas hortorum pv. cynarae]
MAQRKQVPTGKRHPLLRPAQVIKCLVIVDDATHEAVAIEVECAISGHGASRVLDRLASLRYLLQVRRPPNFE